MAEEYCTLDHVDKISVSTRKHRDSLAVLRSLGLGMANLADFTRQCEIEAFEPQETLRVTEVYERSDPTLLLGCVFDWFALNLINYLRTVKLMDLMESSSWELEDIQTPAVQQHIKKQCVKYVQSVAPAVYKWRNKIAAHRAATDPRRNDNLSMLIHSTMPLVTWRGLYYGVIHSPLVMGDLEPPDLDSWELTRTFEDLAPRLWPEARLTSLPSS